MATANLPTLLTIKEVATALRLSERQVRNLLRDQKLPGFRPGGGTWRITEQDLRRFVADGKPTR